MRLCLQNYLKLCRPSLVFAASLLLLGIGNAAAQNGQDQTTVLFDSVNMHISDGSRTVTFNIYFPSEKHVVLEDYSTNREELERLDGFIAELSQNRQATVQSVSITGTGSFDGPFENNNRLALDRAKALADYLKQRYSLFSEIVLTITVTPEDWTGLRAMVDASQMPGRNKVLEIIDSDASSGETEARIRALDGGVPFRYIVSNFIPSTRRAGLVIHLVISEPVVTPSVSEEPAVPDEQPSGEVLPEPGIEDAHSPTSGAVEARESNIPEPTVQTVRGERRKPLYYPKVAVKTNTLLWAGVTPGIDADYYFIPNFGVEYYFGHRWSANAEMAYTYKTYSGREELRALSAYTAEMRFWFKRDDRFRWFYAGIYGMFGDYDYQNGRKPDQDSFTNYTGKHWGAGLTAGVMVPIYRGLCVEAGVRGGFRHYYTNVYDREVSPYHNYYNYQTKTNEWGLAGVYLNVVYRFGKKVYKED